MPKKDKARLTRPNKVVKLVFEQIEASDGNPVALALKLEGDGGREITSAITDPSVAEGYAIKTIAALAEYLEGDGPNFETNQ